MRVARIFLALMLTFGAAIQAQAEEMPELATLLALFSANAMDGGTIRLNWTLDQQSPAVIDFRVYRGYEELGNFSVLCEIPFHAEEGAAEYLFNDTSAIPGVTYYYKLAAQGQLNESIFPVVISAGIPLGNNNGGQSPDAPALVLPGESVRLYVRETGHYKFERVSPDPSLLIDGDLNAGVYEIKTDAGEQSLKLSAGSSYQHTVSWPLQQK